MRVRHDQEARRTLPVLRRMKTVDHFSAVRGNPGLDEAVGHAGPQSDHGANADDRFRNAHRSAGSTRQAQFLEPLHLVPLLARARESEIEPFRLR